MTLQEKCVSLKTAQKLKEAGFPQDTERAYYCLDDGGLFLGHHFGGEAFPDFAAPDAQEIGELLPKWLMTSNTLMDIMENAGAPIEAGNMPCIDGSEVEMRAEAWMWLKYKKLI